MLVCLSKSKLRSVNARRQICNDIDDSIRQMHLSRVNESTHDYESSSEWGTRPERKKNNWSMHLVAYPSGSWEPRSTEETRDHLDNPPAKATCSFPLTNPRMHRPQREGSNNSRQLVLIRPAMRFFLFPQFSFFSFFLFFYFIFTVVLSCPIAGIRRAQRWFSWSTGTDWRCEPHSSRPRATSQWPTEDLDRARPSPLSPSTLRATSGPNRPTVDGGAPTTHSIVPTLFFARVPSLDLFFSLPRVVGILQHRWKTRAGRDISSHVARANEVFIEKRFSMERLKLEMP